MRARLRHALEKRLHSWRRRVARRRLAGHPIGRQVLVMCHGNIWRSPYAAAVLRRELARSGRESVQVSSAGLIGPGRPSPEGAVTAAARRGIDLSGHRSRVVAPGDVAAADLVVVMDGTQERAVRALQRGVERMILQLGDLDPEPIDMRAIRDPDGQPPEVCEASYARIDRCGLELVRSLSPAV